VRRSGNGYIFAAKAEDASSGKPIDQEEAYAPDAKKLPRAVNTVAAKMRRALGDTTPQAAQLEAAETFSSASLEASQKYALGQEAQWNGQWNQALDLWQQSIAIDPNLGRAYAGMAATLANMGRRQDAERDWQIECGAVYLYVSWGKADGDVPSRKWETRIPDGSPHAVAALAHGGIRQPDHRHAGQPAGHVDLDRHRNGIDTEDGGRGEASEDAGQTASAGPARILSDLLKTAAEVEQSATRQKCAKCRNCYGRLTRTVSVLPTLREFDESRLSFLSASTVVSNFCAMAKSVSPALTR